MTTILDLRIAPVSDLDTIEYAVNDAFTRGHTIAHVLLTRDDHENIEVRPTAVSRVRGPIIPLMDMFMTPLGPVFIGSVPPPPEFEADVIIPGADAMTTLQEAQGWFEKVQIGDVLAYGAAADTEMVFVYGVPNREQMNPAGSLRDWCADNGIEYVPHPCGPGGRAVIKTEDERFWAKMRWGGR